MRVKLRISVAAARRGGAGLVAVGVLLLAGCGQKGALTLPSSAASAKSTTPASPAPPASVPSR